MLEGELLPVLDLARLLGESSNATAAWRMIPVSNGNFKALVLSEKEPEPRSIKAGVQRDVPVHLPYPVVYGCYTEGDAIRLILNICALALHFDESRAAELLLPLSPVETTKDGKIETREEAEMDTTRKREVEPNAEEVPTPPETQAITPQMDAMPPSEDAIAEENPLSEPAATLSEVAAPNLLPNAEIPIFIDEDLIEVPSAQPPTTTATSTSLPPSSDPVPPAAEAPGSLAAMEEELFVEEVHLRKQVVDEEPVYRGRRMLVGFVASALFLLGVVYGLYVIGLVHEPSPAQHVESNVTAPQTTATAPAPAPPASLPSAPPQTSTIAPYVVKEGDTLWDIAQRLTGDPLNYHNLAGRNLIKNPDLIFPGQTIQIDSQQKH
jgi:LysM repeat protein